MALIATRLEVVDIVVCFFLAHISTQKWACVRWCLQNCVRVESEIPVDCCGCVCDARSMLAWHWGVAVHSGTAYLCVTEVNTSRFHRDAFKRWKATIRQLNQCVLRERPARGISNRIMKELWLYERRFWWPAISFMRRLKGRNLKVLQKSKVWVISLHCGVRQNCVLLVRRFSAFELTQQAVLIKLCGINPQTGLFSIPIKNSKHKFYSFYKYCLSFAC